MATARAVVFHDIYRYRVRLVCVVRTTERTMYLFISGKPIILQTNYSAMIKAPPCVADMASSVVRTQQSCTHTLRLRASPSNAACCERAAVHSTYSYADKDQIPISISHAKRPFAVPPCDFCSAVRSSATATRGTTAGAEPQPRTNPLSNQPAGKSSDGQ